MGSKIKTYQRKIASLFKISCSNIIEKPILNNQIVCELTSQKVIELLKYGNDVFVSQNFTIRNNLQRINSAKQGQYPVAVILSCVDSRVPVEDIFQKSVGDLFVARIAGNVINNDIIGSMEYACKFSTAKVIVVMGHDDCGAIKAAVDQLKVGNLTQVLQKISPAIEEINNSFDGEKTSKNKTYLHEVCSLNIKNSINQIREKSHILREMENLGDIKIIGAIYHIKTGKIDFINT